jgi:PadR family transcriptional regulator, regulatory protein PadR
VPDHDPQVLKGILSMLLLRVLCDREDYGYSVVVRLQDLGFTALAEGSIYPALSRLEGKGLLTSRLEQSQSGPARKYYRPTASGIVELDRAERAWTALRANVDRVMTPKLTVMTSTRPDELQETAP